MCKISKIPNFNQVSIKQLEQKSSFTGDPYTYTSVYNDQKVV